MTFTEQLLKAKQEWQQCDAHHKAAFAKHEPIRARFEAGTIGVNDYIASRSKLDTALKCYDAAEAAYVASVNLLRARLTTLVTRYDRRQEEAANRNPKRYYNPRALAQYLKAVDRVTELHDIDTCFCAALLAYINKGIEA